MAYQAEERKELLNAINEFLDESIVLPPGKWDKKTLLPIMDMAKEKARQRQLKEKIPRKFSGWGQTRDDWKVISIPN